MSCMINSIVMKPTTFSTTTNGDLIFFSTNKTFFPNPSSVFSIQSKPIKPHLISCSISQSPFSFSAKLKNTRYPSLISFAFEDNTAVLGEEDEIGEFSWDNEDSDGVPEVEVSEWEGDVEEVEAVGDAGESADHYVKYSKPSEDCKVFVGNLSYDIGSLNLASIFDEAGRVDEAQVITNRETGESRGFGFVSMHTVEEAERAVKMFSGYEVNGRLLTVNKAAPRGTQPQRQPRGSEPPNKIYVGNLAWEVDNAHLEQVFSQYGRVLSARVVTDRVSSRSKGFGFVTMSTESELNDAISNLDGQILKGREIKVNMAEERRPKSF